MYQRNTLALIIAAIGLSFSLTSPAVSANEATPEREKQFKLLQSRGCSSCHGTKGQGRPAMGAPKLAGQTQESLSKKLKAYRSGERSNPIMKSMTQSLSDEDISLLATWFSQLK